MIVAKDHHLIGKSRNGVKLVTVFAQVTLLVVPAGTADLVSA